MAGRGRSVLLAGLLLSGASGALVGCTGESGERTPPATSPDPLPPGALRLDDAEDPQLLRAGDGLVVVASQPRTGPGGAVLVATYADGAWSPVEELSAPGHAEIADVTLNDAGAGLALLFPSPEDVATVRVRGEDGAWSAAETLGGLAYGAQAIVGERGHIAVGGYDQEGEGTVQLRTTDGGWRALPGPANGDVSYAFDGEGGLHAAFRDWYDDEGGIALTSFLPPGGDVWTPAEPVGVEATTETAAPRMVALPDGSEVVVVGVASPNYEGSEDRSVRGTAVEVYRRSDRTEPFVRMWSKDGASEVRAFRRGDRVALTWVQLDDDSPGAALVDGADVTEVPYAEDSRTCAPDDWIWQVTTAGACAGGTEPWIARPDGDAVVVRPVPAG